MRLECAGSSICMTENGQIHPSLGACRSHFTVQLSAWGGRGSFTTFRRASADILEEHSPGMTVRLWYRRGAPSDKGSVLPASTPKKRTHSTGVLRTPRPLGNAANTMNVGRHESRAALPRRRRTTSFAPSVSPAPAPTTAPEPEPAPKSESAPEPQPEPEPHGTPILHLGDLPPIQGQCADFSPYLGSPRCTNPVTPVVSESDRTMVTASGMEFLTKEQHRRAITSFKEQVFSGGAVIHVEGKAPDPATEFCIVQDGSVICSIEDTYKKTLNGGATFGRLDPFGKAVCITTVAAGAEGVRLLCASRQDFWTSLQPSIADTNVSKSGMDAKVDDDPVVDTRLDAKLEHMQKLLEKADRAAQNGAANRALDACEIDAIAFEDACKDVNDLAAASWRAIMVCKQLISARQKTLHDGSDRTSWKLYFLLRRVVRSFRSRRIAAVTAEFGPHEKVVTRVQARIRGFLERRRLRQDSADAAKAGANAAMRDVGNLTNAELDFWDWPRVSG